MDANGIKLTPKDIVSKLNEYIVGQDDAKRKVAIALRNRYRRSLLDEEAKQEIAHWFSDEELYDYGVLNEKFTR